jgi:hypothetical protein
VRYYLYFAYFILLFDLNFFLSSRRCVLTAVFGMLIVLWYALFGGAISDEEIEHQVRAKLAAKATKRRLFGILPPPKKE